MKSIHECEAACQGKSTMLAVGIPGTNKCEAGRGCHCWCYLDATEDGSCEQEDDSGLTLFRFKDFSKRYFIYRIQITPLSFPLVFFFKIHVLRFLGYKLVV